MQLAGGRRHCANVVALVHHEPLPQQARVQDGRVDESKHGEEETRRRLAQVLTHHHDRRQRVSDGADDDEDGRAVQPHVVRRRRRVFDHARLRRHRRFEFLEGGKRLAGWC